MGSLCIARENTSRNTISPIAARSSLDGINPKTTKHTEEEVIRLAPPAPMEIEEENSDDDKSIIGRCRSTWTSLLISGYIRQNWNSLQITARFPEYEVLLLIRSWCYFVEKIDLENSDITDESMKITQINNNSNDDELEIIECTKDVYGCPPFHVFGTNVYTKGQRIKWRFKIKEHWGCHIGIIEADKARRKQLSFSESNEVGGYGLYTMDNRTYHNASVPWKKLWDNDIEDNDIIEMELDLTEREFKFGTLVFRKNGNDGGKIAFKGIVSNKEYKLAIAMRSMQSIALLRDDGDGR